MSQSCRIVGDRGLRQIEVLEVSAVRLLECSHAVLLDP
jgi:hypothetical protein